MKKSDLTAQRQQQLVPVAGYSGAFALAPPPAPRSLPSRSILTEVTKAHEALGALAISAVHLPNPDLVTRTLDRREAVRSSQIEGTRSEMDELFAYEATGSEEGLPPDVVETLNYVRSLEYGLNEVREKGTGALSCGLIKALHGQLMRDVPHFRGVPGLFREQQNWIGGGTIYQARFVPPPAEHVGKCMAELEEFLQETSPEDAQYEVSIVVRMAIAHAQFETIHPFLDGNGRVGRLLPPLMLSAEGYPPVYVAGFLKSNQREYYDTLAGVQLREEWREWVRFFALAVTESVRESVATAHELHGLLTRWESQVAAARLRSDSVAHRLPRLLIGTPVVTARSVESSLGVSFPAANNALARLVELGILKPAPGRQRYRMFVAQELIDLLNRPADYALSTGQTGIGA